MLIPPAAAEYLPVYCNERHARYLITLVRRLTYLDALLSSGRRVEYVNPVYGIPFYVLYNGKEAVGLQYVTASDRLNSVQLGLARYLAAIGFTPGNTELKLDAARTPLTFQHNRLPHLWDHRDTPVGA